MQGTCVFGTGCRGARLVVWLILNDRVQPSFIAGVILYERPYESQYLGSQDLLGGLPYSLCQRHRFPALLIARLMGPVC